MCILVIKPSGIQMPKKEILENCFYNNEDGAGFAYADGRKLFLSKGHMTFDKFYEALESRGDLTKYPVMLHFRIATHGTVRAENTHPFNVIDGVVAAHNGILSIKPVGDMTDSETFFKYICAPVIKHTGIKSKELESVVTHIIETSKVAFLDDKGALAMFGKFETENGVYYSNTTYKSYYGRYGGYSTVYKHGSSKFGYGRNSYGRDYYDHDFDYNSGYESGTKYNSFSPSKSAPNTGSEHGTGDKTNTMIDTHWPEILTIDDKWDVVCELEQLISFDGLKASEAFEKIMESYGLSSSDLESIIYEMGYEDLLITGLDEELSKVMDSEENQDIHINL